MLEYCTIYNLFLNDLSKEYPPEIIDNLKNMSDKTKYDCGKKLMNLLNSETYFNYFVKCKIKIFSHKEHDTLKISESLFGKTLNLKKIFNNKDEDIKTKYWGYLHNLIYLLKKEILDSDPSNKKIEEEISRLKVNKVMNSSKAAINKIFDTSVLNSSTNELIDDIIDSFEKSFLENSKNPFENVMKIKEMIEDKYKDKIASGEISVPDIMTKLQKHIPDIINNLKKNIPGSENILNSINTGGFLELLNKKEDPVVIMDENFSTSAINVGKPDESKSNIKLGSLLKTYDSLNTSGLGNIVTSLQEGRMPDISDLMKDGKMPDLNQLMDILKDSGLPDVKKIIEDNGIDLNILASGASEIISNNNIDLNKLAESANTLFTTGNIDMNSLLENIDFNKISNQSMELLQQSKIAEVD